MKYQYLEGLKGKTCVTFGIEWGATPVKVTDPYALSKLPNNNHFQVVGESEPKQENIEEPRRRGRKPQ